MSPSTATASVLERTPPAVSLPAGDALSLPLVAYRGLWDKFDGPDTMGSWQRAYRRGVASLARVNGGALPLDAVLTRGADASVNRGWQPLYLVTAALPDLTPFLTSLAVSAPRVFAVIDAGPAVPCGLFQWTRDRWRRIGSYVPVAVSPADLQRAHVEDGFILFESANVVGNLRQQASLPQHRDDTLLGALRALAGPQVSIARVSDLVELDQLDLRIREAV